MSAAAELVAFALIAALAALAAWHASAYGLFHQGEPGAGLFPFLAATFAFVFALAAIVADLRTRGAPRLLRRAPSAGTVAAVSVPAPRSILWRKLSLYVAVMLVWPWLLVPLGFMISTALALLAIMRLAEGMRWTPTLAVLVGTVIASWLLFERLLGVPLPRGWLGIG